MKNYFDQLKESIDNIERDKLTREIFLEEQKNGHIPKSHYLLSEKIRSYLKFISEISIGLSIGVFTLIINYLLFVWLLHIEFK